MAEQASPRLSQTATTLAEALNEHNSEACMRQLVDILRALDAQERHDFDAGLRYLRDKIDSRVRTGHW